MKRVFIIVLDSFGIGALPDAANYGDQGSDTLAACFASGKLFVPQMQQLGLFNIQGVQVGQPCQSPAGAFGRMAERSAGKDTTTGHWELMGLVSEKPMPTYPDGFPQRIIEQLTQRTGRGVLCNRPYSGTQVIHDYGEQQLQTGDLIVYTSADSVLRLQPTSRRFRSSSCTNTAGLPARSCRVRTQWEGSSPVPFVGEDAEHFYRTANRRDFSLLPPQDTLLDCLQKTGLQTIGVGKISDIFAGKGISQKIVTHSNDEGMQRTLELCNSDFEGLCFVNLVEFDMLYGHRNDPVGYAQALSRFDSQLGQLLGLLREEDLLFITADHGCDPSTPSTDHSREYVPLLCCGKSVRAGVDLATRSCFADLAATVGEYFDPAFPGKLQAGSSFLQQLLK